MKNDTDKKPRIIIIGASMNTGNLGVSALLASTVKCLLNMHPDAVISLLDGSPEPKVNLVKLKNGQVIHLDQVGVRYNKILCVAQATIAQKIGKKKVK